MTRWAAPTASGPVNGNVVVPGSKSASARALVLAALAGSGSTLTGVLDSRDTRLMRAALSSLGVAFADQVDGLRVTPPDAFTPGRVDVGLAGTVMRFVPPIAALAVGPTAFTGDPEATARPVRPLLDGLRQVGVHVDGDALPFTVVGSGHVPGGAASIDASGSSQFVSGLLLAAARFDAGLVLTHRGGPVPSLPHLALTAGMLRDRGVQLSEPGPGDTTWRVEPGPLAARDEAIEPDLVNAATFFAAAAATGGSVSTAWPHRTLQAADRILEVFTELGATVTRTDGRVTVTGGTLRGADLDLAEVSELTCVVSALLALADGPGRIRGVGHVRHHETDRLAALETELAHLGCGVRQTADGLAVTPRPLHRGTWATYADHRMAHAGAVLGLVLPGVLLDDVTCTTKTMPDFVGLWQHLVTP